MSILVIDDDVAVLEMVSEMLNSEGVTVLTAANGEEGMRLIRGHSEIDLVITDLIMPEKEGMETIRELKRDFPHIRILAISGGGRVSAQSYLTIAKALGADLTLGKPFVRQELLDAVHALSKQD
jgi:CheY-like chemotaxis protein